MSQRPPIRVFQFATGNVGTEMIPRIGEHPDLELVGLYCYTPEKIGRDAGEIVGYTAGDDVSSRDIEGENPLYLPQAKVYDGSCALGPGIVLAGADAMSDLPIVLSITRGGQSVFEGETSSAQLKRSLGEIAGWLFKELTFPHGAFVMTGTGIVPPDEFTLDGFRAPSGKRHIVLRRSIFPRSRPPSRTPSRSISCSPRCTSTPTPPKTICCRSPV